MAQKMIRSRIRRYAIVGIGLIVLLLAPVPINSIDHRNSEDQLAERGVKALRVERKRYFPPREWRFHGGLNPLNYSHWAPDPWFSAYVLKSASLGSDAERSQVSYQLISVNENARKEDIKERVLAVEMKSKVFEYSLPVWTSGLVNSDIVYVGTLSGEMIFLYTESRTLYTESGHVPPSGIFFYFLSMPLPLQSNVFNEIDSGSTEAKRIIDQINVSAEPSLIKRFCEPTISPLIRLYVREYLNWSCN